MENKPIDIKALRKRLNLTREQMAVRLGVTYKTIYQWETKKALPSPLSIRAIEDLINDPKPTDSKG